MPRKSIIRSYAEIADFLGVSRALVRSTLRQYTASGQITGEKVWHFINEGVLAHQSDSTPKRQPIGADQRKRIFDRDGKRCRYCGRVTFSTTRCLDHIIPWSRGGRNYDVNLVICCKACNIAKGTKTVAEANMRLINCPDCNENLYHVQKGLAMGRAAYQVKDIRLLMDE